MDLPVVGGFAVVALVIAYRLLTERSEIKDLRSDVMRLESKLAALEVKDEENRSEKHRLNTELTIERYRVGVILSLAERAAARCTCDAAGALAEILTDRRVNPLETPPRA